MVRRWSDLRPEELSSMTRSSDRPAGTSPPVLRIEVRASFVCELEGIDVPLGHLDGGRWVAPPFVDYDAGVNEDELAEWPAQEQPFGPPLAFSLEHARAMVRDTSDRCQALAE